MGSELALAVVRAIEDGDKAGLRRLYAADATFWHNTDGAAQDADASLGATEVFMDLFSERTFEDLRVQDLPDGFVQQHRLSAIGPDGSPVAFHGCMVCQVRAGQIVRVEEYVDSAALAPVFAAISPEIAS